jgi:DNA-binding NarL/FixJ family response regulator
MVREVAPELPTVVIGKADSTDELALESLRAGAQEYLVLHQYTTAELMRVLRFAMHRKLGESRTVTGPRQPGDGLEPAAVQEEPKDDLSERERQVLIFMAYGYSNKEIAAKLALSVKSIETYKARLLRKLEMHSRVQIVHYALERGWLQDG